MAARLQDIFGRDNFFIELQDHGIPAQHETNPKLLEIAKKIRAPLLATNDSHYTHQEDHGSHDALLCVQTGALLSDAKRFKFEGHEHYLKTAQEMRYLFRELPEACDNTLWIAERADLARKSRYAETLVYETASEPVPSIRALELLVKQKRMNKTALVDCIVRADGLADQRRLDPARAGHRRHHRRDGRQSRSRR